MKIEAALFEKLWRNANCPEGATDNELAKHLLNPGVIGDNYNPDGDWHADISCPPSYSNDTYGLSGWIEDENPDLPQKWSPDSGEDIPKPVILRFLRYNLNSLLERRDKGDLDADVHPGIAFVPLESEDTQKSLCAAVSIAGYSFSGVDFAIVGVFRDEQGARRRLRRLGLVNGSVSSKDISDDELLTYWAS